MKGTSAMRFALMLVVSSCLTLSCCLRAQEQQPTDGGENVEEDTAEPEKPELTPEQKQAAAEDIRMTARETISALIDDAGGCSVEMQIFGRVAEVQVDSASEDGIEVIFDEELLEVGWDEVGDKILGRILLALAQSPEDKVRAGVLIRLGGEREEGNKIIRSTLAEAGGQGEEAGDKAATLKAIRESVFGPEKEWKLVLSSGTGTSAGAVSKPLAGEKPRAWEPLGLCGGGSMYNPAFSPADPNLMMVNCDMGAQYISRDGGHNWRMIHYKQLRSNIHFAPAFHPKDPNTVYAADSVLKVSHDLGETWEALGSLSGRPAGKLAIDADNPDFMLTSTADSVFRSVNGGANWTECSGPTGPLVGFLIDRTSPVAGRSCIVASPGGVWKTTDGGKTWVDAASGLPSRDVKSLAGGSKKTGRKTSEVILYSALESGIYVSEDKGESWKKAAAAGIPDVSWCKFLLSTDIEPRRVYAILSAPPENTRMFRSDDAAESFKEIFFPNSNLVMTWRVAFTGSFYSEFPNNAAICSSDPDRIATADMMKVEITNNGGKSFFSGQSLHKPNSPETGEGSEWLCNGLVVTSTWHYYVDPFEPNRHYICYTDIGFARSVDGGKSWKHYIPGKFSPWRNTTYELAFDPEIPGKIWGAFSNVHDIPHNNIISGRHRSTGPGGVCVSTDFATSWRVSNNGLPVAPCCSIVIDPESPKNKRTLYAAVFDNGVFKSTDDGNSWVKKSNGLGSAQNMRAYRVILHADGTLFALVTAKQTNGNFEIEGAGLYRSKDNAENWEKITVGKRFGWPKDFNVDPEDSSVIYLGNSRCGGEPAGLYRTTDGGKSWAQIGHKGTEHFGAYFHPSRKGWIYMTLTEDPPGAGLWLSRDGGGSWEPFNQLPFDNIQRVTVDPGNANRIFVTTFGGSVWTGPAEPVK